MFEKVTSQFQKMNRVTVLDYTRNGLDLAVEVARVSSLRKNKRANGERLLSYLVKHNHWSPFEHSYVSMEIKTSRAISAQLLRHRSMTFQEMSQRYTNPDEMYHHDLFEPIELRLQDKENKQSSIEMETDDRLEETIRNFLAAAGNLYNTLISKGIAKECARMILPLASKTTIIMTGNIRSWVHFINARASCEAQKEIREIANECKSKLIECYPRAVLLFE